MSVHILLYIVSLFTREWIEIFFRLYAGMFAFVSLFTREWIEIAWKAFPLTVLYVSLFTREWIEIFFGSSTAEMTESLPLYEGVD